jgi:hypothetical protein
MANSNALYTNDKLAPTVESIKFSNTSADNTNKSSSSIGILLEDLKDDSSGLKHALVIYESPSKSKYIGSSILF